MDHMTAKVSCFARAYHYNNNRICIFRDSAAGLLLGNEYGQIAENMMNGIHFFFPGFDGTKEEGLRLIADKALSVFEMAIKVHPMGAPTGVGYVLAKRKTT